MFYNTVIPRSYIDCSETSDVRGVSSGWDTSSGMGRVVPDNLFDHEKNIFIPTKNLL